MGITEIILIIIGIVVFAVSFLVPEKYADKDKGSTAEQEKKLKAFLQRELQNIRQGIEEKVDESMVASTEKTERYMERITNEKIMAIQEYSDTVLEQIHKNHEEAVFLYDMLNSKHDQIKHTAGEISSTVEGAKEKLENTVDETTRELLRGSIKENLVERIKNMLQESVQEAVDTSIRESLQDKVDYSLQQQLDEIIREKLDAVIQAAAREAVKEAVDSSVPRKAVKEAVDSSAPRKTEVPETEKETGKETKKAEFKEFSFEMPEVILEEEQPLMVQSIKKTAPKKKTPAKKNMSRAKVTLAAQTETEPHHQPEAAGAAGNKETILKLHREGKSNVAIARELGLGIGEVKLVIGLYE
ncbi:MAG: DUF6115 domain-containing protein [Lachnospiraceae bacterium]